MGLSLPSELDFLKWVVGSDWPEADEDALRRCAHAWATAAQRLADMTPETRVSGASGHRGRRGGGRGEL